MLRHLRSIWGFALMWGTSTHPRVIKIIAHITRMIYANMWRGYVQMISRVLNIRSRELDFKTDCMVEYLNAAPKDDVFWEFYLVFLGGFCVGAKATIKTLTLGGHVTQQVGAGKPIPMIGDQLIAAFRRVGRSKNVQPT